MKAQNSLPERLIDVNLFKGSTGRVKCVFKATKGSNVCFLIFRGFFLYNVDQTRRNQGASNHCQVIFSKNCLAAKSKSSAFSTRISLNLFFLAGAFKEASHISGTLPAAAQTPDRPGSLASSVHLCNISLYRSLSFPRFCLSQNTGLVLHGKRCYHIPAQACLLLNWASWRVIF